MENVILLDIPDIHIRLLPITFTRPIAEITIGIDTIAAKWQRMLPGKYSYRTVDYLSELFPQTSSISESLVIASHILPTADLISDILRLKAGQCLLSSESAFIAARGIDNAGQAVTTMAFKGELNTIIRPTDIFMLNGKTLEDDFHMLTAGRESLPISQTCTVIGNPEDIFISKDAKVEGAFLNTASGPIYIGVGAEVMEGACLRGPIAIGDYSTVNMGTKIYGATTLGCHCKVGGELNNVVIHPYSNKAHDGFLGNAVIGSWCNLGAGCVASNLKNDYTEIKLWDYASRRFMRTGLQFCGLIMGDHSKAGINTMFNTATVTGVGVNIHGSGFPRNFVASFSEGSATTGFTDVPLSKFFAIAERAMARRDIQLTDPLRRLYTRLYEITETYK